MRLQGKLARLLLWHRGLMHDIRWWKASAIAVMMYVLGWYLVHLWVSRLGTEATVVRSTVSVVMIYPTFRIHRWLWKDRDCGTGLGARWSITWLQIFLIHWLVYWEMVHRAGLPYMKTGLLLSIPFAILGYWRRDESDFAVEEETEV
jgi:hypothetical protein